MGFFFSFVPFNLISNPRSQKRRVCARKSNIGKKHTQKNDRSNDIMQRTRVSYPTATNTCMTNGTSGQTGRYYQYIRNLDHGLLLSPISGRIVVYSTHAKRFYLTLPAVVPSGVYLFAQRIQPTLPSSLQYLRT